MKKFFVLLTMVFLGSLSLFAQIQKIADLGDGWIIELNPTREDFYIVDTNRTYWNSEYAFNIYFTNGANVFTSVLKPYYSPASLGANTLIGDSSHPKNGNYEVFKLEIEQFMIVASKWGAGFPAAKASKAATIIVDEFYRWK
jgi:hypothetical protein